MTSELEAFKGLVAATSPSPSLASFNEALYEVLKTAFAEKH
jgi:hypothetical protein